MDTQIDTKQHTDLIASNRVEGTAVYDRAGNKLGSISHFMVSKRQGSVAYAVLSFGSFLGMGGEEYTLPWESLEYDQAQGGYVVDITKDQLDGAPRYETDRGEDYNRDYYESVSGYYRTNPPVW